MMKPSIQFKDGCLLVRGELVFETVMKILKESKQYFQNIHTLKIDFSDVTHADSASLALFCEWQRYAKAKQINLVFINTPKQLMQIAQISKVDQLLGLK
ncbi:MAG: hypothetical protein A3E87_03685 [Gammaproteobacteria bacterium RIFCSPHIGHO2_12_FULL_35_23]|nr:MAG: hypothetical protein A3E87_03685 [Gammaproteobacteria bacterium RIFCSPHIGHO2_12_FULL_35_23]